MRKEQIRFPLSPTTAMKKQNSRTRGSVGDRLEHMQCQSLSGHSFVGNNLGTDNGRPGHPDCDGDCQQRHEKQTQC